MSILSKISVFSLLVISPLAFAQSTTQEDLGAITASHVSSGLGWVLGSSETEFAAAAAAGATHVRLTACNWATVEGQSAPPNNVSSGYSLPSVCLSGLNFAKKYGLQPTVLAAYGAPYHQILTVTLPSGAAPGATTLAVEYVSGVGGKNLASIAYPYAYIAAPDGSTLTGKHSYSGSLVSGVSLTSGTTANVGLTSALTTTLPAGTTLYINEILYPSPSSGNPSDPSVIAYAHYAEYLAKQLNALGIVGEVELWNEPAWFGDCWDNRRDCYDVDPKWTNELQGNGANYGFAAALQTTTPIPGVNYVWAGTNKSASQSMLGARMPKYSGAAFLQPQPTITAESLHPYGNNPEDAMWSQPCLVANLKLGAACNIIPVNNSNMVVAEGESLAARAIDPAFGINHVITETGASTLNGDINHITRYVMRQYLGFMADDVSYLEFYRLYDTRVPGETGFSFVTLTNNDTSFTPLQPYTAIAGLMSDLAPMKAPPIGNLSSVSLPAVTAYNGTYNLDHVAVVGARPGDSANSILYVLWQRSQWQESSSAVVCAASPTTPCWATISQPAEAATTVTIPSGLKVSQVMNLDTRVPVSYSQSGSTLTVGVSDDPIGLMFIPSGDGAAASITPKLLFVPIADQMQGSSVVADAASLSKGAITYSVVSGSATISGRTVTATGPGAVVLKATQAANGIYTAATATSSFNVTAITPILTFTKIPTKTYGVVVGMKTASNSPGAITYSIASGPATISGATVTTTGIGTVVVQANQASSGIFAAATATTSFLVAPQKTILTFGMSSQIVGTPLALNATSASNAPVVYSVVSGPATVSGSTANFTASGTVTIQATQAAIGGYTGATATASCHVGVADPKLVLAVIPTTPYNTSITLSSTSLSSVAVTYSVVSGPARIVGSTLTTLSTAGTVVVQATQRGNTAYGPASVTASFAVAPQGTPNLTFTNIPSKTAGDVFQVSATSNSAGAISYSIVSGPATISGSTVTATDAGTVVLKASQAAAGAYSAATATATFAVAAAATKAANLTFQAVPGKHFGDTFKVTATSSSPSPITYSVVNGYATISGSTVTIGSPSTSVEGTVTLQASQVASGGYGAASTTVTFSAKALAPAISFASISPQTVGSVFSANAMSTSKGAITYRILSGPAHISGSTVLVTGRGTIVLRADQDASGNYGPAHTSTNIQAE